jgi:hypothetical protein
MKRTSLSLKKQNLILGFTHERMESRFLSQFLIGGNPFIEWHYGLKLEDVEPFAKRCADFEVIIIGFEIHPESHHPMIITVFEEFDDEYTNNWYLKAIEKYQKLGIESMIVPYVNVKNETIQKYLSSYE